MRIRKPTSPCRATPGGVSPRLERPIKRMALAAPAVALALGAAPAYAIDDIIETQEAFLAEAFGATPPPAKVLDLSGGTQSQIESALGHPLLQTRLHYWKAGNRSAWVFEDKGKQGYQPTLCGFVISGGAVDIARVLIYRESHGEEVTQPSFLKQFAGARAAGNQLDRHIDGISGATLSVLMMQRMARAAIAMDSIAP